MPANSARFAADPVRVTIPFAGETIEVEFDRNRFTENWFRRLQDGMESGDVSSSSRALAEIVTAWNLVEEDGQPTPVTVDVLAELPFPLIRLLDEAIGEAAVPSSAEGNGLGDISSTANTTFGLTQAIPPNGPTPSQSPTVSESLSSK